jgi:hypothetical protein
VNATLKMTTIDMDWDDKGARVLSSIPFPCPLCPVLVTPNVEHLCGDRLPKFPAKRKRRKRHPEVKG